VSYFIEHGAPGDAIATSGNESEYPGRVSVAALWPKITQTSAALYYISGPPAMLTRISQDLLARGVAADSIRADAWE